MEVFDNRGPRIMQKTIVEISHFKSQLKTGTKFQ